MYFPLGTNHSNAFSTEYVETEHSLREHENKIKKNVVQVPGITESLKSLEMGLREHKEL